MPFPLNSCKKGLSLLNADDFKFKVLHTCKHAEKWIGCEELQSILVGGVAPEHYTHVVSKCVELMLLSATGILIA